MSELTAKQQLFVDEYLKCYNATQAARLAGYKGSYSTLGVTGHDNLKNPKIAEAIKRRFQESAMSADEVLARLAEQARVNIGEFFTLEDEAARRTISEVFGEEVEVEGKKQILVLRLSYQKIKEKGHLIKSLTWTQYGPKLELHDGQTALLNIGKHHKLFTESLKVEADLTLQKWLERLAGNNE